MASGSFHDGSTHSGSFHSSGSFGSFGGDSSGGGYDGGSFGGAVSGLSTTYVFMYILFCGVGVAEVFLSVLSVYHIIVLIIFVIAFVMFIPGFGEKNRFAAIGKIKKKDIESFQGSVWSTAYSEKRVGDDYTWYGQLDKNYSISFFDKVFGNDNVKAVRETVKRSPGIIWVKTTTWLAWAIVCAVCNLFFYSLVIPFFEKAYMSDAAFAFVDILTFFLPSVLALICSIFSWVFVKAKDKLLYECAVRVVNDNRAKEQKLRTERNIERKLSKKWYFNDCPNCGAIASPSVKHCAHCGTSLEVRSLEGVSSSDIHTLAKTGEKQ